MAQPQDSRHDQVLAIDIGATAIKFCRTDDRGALLEVPRRRPTPYPCTPERLIDLLSERIRRSKCPRVGVGFPGEFAEGHVVRPGNLSRPGGVTTETDPVLDRQWRNFAFEEALRQATGRNVRVVNDATLAALGCCEGVGAELVLSLGTGLGLALCVDGSLRKVRDVGAEVFLDGRTYDQVLGERSRSEDQAVWQSMLELAVGRFVKEFGATIVHLAGGNARRVAPDSFTALSCRVVIEGNEAALHGAARLFYN